MSTIDDGRKHDLECARLANEFIQLSRGTFNPELKAHCIRMAAYWTDQIAASSPDDPSDPTA
ncbi:hypothetical protein SR870_00505 [Rhodopseudomonas palustris]|uniref:hypothetical protein n=1 Tax=Rhodopseudomonas palustris TaxID=1076 RepID=UPI002ACE6819|nr:hypothetical protein [Rhodopseudomonas palustris]WQG99809.1 hypothetical protein SR870_00505 [Rhodopseudomonas palustris]